ncbi:MAG: hypothetical protein AAGA56_24930 [Myxococcota bacterium]
MHETEHRGEPKDVATFRAGAWSRNQSPLHVAGNVDAICEMLGAVEKLNWRHRWWNRMAVVFGLGATLTHFELMSFCLYEWDSKGGAVFLVLGFIPCVVSGFVVAALGPQEIPNVERGHYAMDLLRLLPWDRAARVELFLDYEWAGNDQPHNWIHLDGTLGQDFVVQYDRTTICRVTMGQSDLRMKGHRLTVVEDAVGCFEDRFEVRGRGPTPTSDDVERWRDHWEVVDADVCLATAEAVEHGVAMVIRGHAPLDPGGPLDVNRQRATHPTVHALHRAVRLLASSMVTETAA